MSWLGSNFSAAYAAVHPSHRGFDRRKDFSSAYAAVHHLPVLPSIFERFPAAYAAVHKRRNQRFLLYVFSAA